MYHAHYRLANTITVKDRTAFVPCYSEFRHSHGQGRLLESACACGHGLASWSSGCGLRKSTLVHPSPARKPVFLRGCWHCRWHFDGFVPFRLGEGGGAERIVAQAKGDGFGGHLEFGYGVELHNWVQEAISLLMRFEWGISPISGDSNGLHYGSSLLPCVHNLADECEPSFKFGQCCFSEEANIDVNGATKNVDVAVEGIDRAPKFSHVSDDREWEDDGFCYEWGTVLRRHGSSLKRQQGNHELQHEFSLRGKHSESDPKKTQKHDLAGTESTTSKVSCRHRVTVDTSDKAESSIGASSVGIARGKQLHFFGDDRYSNKERSKGQEISGDVQHFSKIDEIKVCLVDKQKKKSSSSTSVSRHEEQFTDAKVENINIAAACSGSVGGSSSCYGTAQVHGVAKAKPRQRHEIGASDDVTESGAAVIDARYTSRMDESVFVNEAEGASASLDKSAGTNKNQEKTVEGVSWNHVPQQTDSLVSILASDMSKLHTSKEYVDKNDRPSDIGCLQRTSTGSAQATERLYRDQSSMQKMPTASSSELPVGISPNISSGHQTAECTFSDYVYQDLHHSDIKCMKELSCDSMQTGARISEPLTLQDQSRSHPFQWATKISLENTDAHQSDEYTTKRYVARCHDLEYHQESGDNSTKIGVTDSVQAAPPEISVVSSSVQTASTGFLSGSSGYQLPGYASNDDIGRHQSSLNVNYAGSQIDTTISGQLIFQEPPPYPSLQWVFYGYPRTAGKHQSTVSTTNEACESLKVNSDVTQVLTQGKVPSDHPDPNDIVKECSYLPIESGCSRPIIPLEKSSDGSRHPPAGGLHLENLTSQRIVEKTEKTYIVERERSFHQTTTLSQQLVLVNPPPNSNASSVQGSSSENVVKDSGMQISRQSSLSSETGKQPDEMWAIARETLGEHSSMEKMPEAVITPVTPGSVAKLTEVTSTVRTTEATDTASLGNPIVKRSSRNLSAAKSSLSESGSNEAWFARHEPEDEESLRKEKEGMLKEPGSAEGSPDAFISVGTANKRQDITVEGSLSMLADSKVDTASPMGPFAHGPIQEKASSISDNPLLDSVTNSASIGSLSVSVSGTVSPDVVACSTGIDNVQQQEKLSVLPVTSPKVGRKKLGAGSFEPCIKDSSERDASNEGKKRVLGSRKLRRAQQVQRERFEAWEEAYSLENEQRKTDEMFMREALAEARKAADIWEVPIGAVLVQDGKIIARGHNFVEELRDSTAHAEMLCIRDASRKLRTWRLAETTLYVTLEPCPMCAGAILQARIGTLVWGAPNKLLGADGSWVRLFPSVNQGQDMDQGSHSPAPVHPFHPNMNIRRGILSTECSDMMQQFFQLRRKKAKTPETPSPLSVTRTKFFSRMHNILHVMFRS